MVKISVIIKSSINIFTLYINSIKKRHNNFTDTLQK